MMTKEKNREEETGTGKRKERERGLSFVLLSSIGFGAALIIVAATMLIIDSSTKRSRAMTACNNAAEVIYASIRRMNVAQLIYQKAALHDSTADQALRDIGAYVTGFSFVKRVQFVLNNQSEVVLDLMGMDVDPVDNDRSYEKYKYPIYKDIQNDSLATINGDVEVRGQQDGDVLGYVILSVDVTEFEAGSEDKLIFYIALFSFFFQVIFTSLMLAFGRGFQVMLTSASRRMHSQNYHPMSLSKYAIKEVKCLETLFNTVIEKQFELNRKNTSISTAYNTKTELLRIAAHEIRTPITSIKTQVDQALEYLKRDRYDSAKEKMEGAILSTETIDRHICAILNLSDLERGQLKLTYSTFPIQKLFDELNTIFLPKAKTGKIQLNFTSAIRNTEIETDYDILFLIISNAVDNAIKFTSGVGRSVSVGIECSGHADQGICIFVKDDGPGLDDMQIKQLLNDDIGYYHQRDNANAVHRNPGGWGIGFRAIAQFTKFMDGELDINGAKGVGVKMDIKFPQISLLNPAIPIPIPENIMGSPVMTTSDFADISILALDDSMNWLKEFKETVELSEDITGLSVRIEQAKNSFDALELWFDNDYDIVFVDFCMPGDKNGIQVLNCMSQESKEKSDKAKKILVSSNINIHDEIDKSRCSYDEFWSKGFSAEKLAVLFQEVHKLRKKRHTIRLV